MTAWARLFSLVLLASFAFTAIAPSLDAQVIKSELIELLDGAEGEEREIQEADAVDAFFHFAHDALKRRNDRSTACIVHQMEIPAEVYLPVVSPPPEA